MAPQAFRQQAELGGINQ